MMRKYEMKIWQIPDGDWGWMVRIDERGGAGPQYVTSEEKARRAALTRIHGYQRDDAIRAAQDAASWESIDA